MDIASTQINTAGAYICIHGLYVFAMGIRPHNGRIPVVRLGGHREVNETGWQCAVREVYEEANLKIEPLVPQTTYLCNWDTLESELQKTQWRPATEQNPVPLLVIQYCHDNNLHVSVMYLAHADGFPTPSSEVKGLVLLEEEEVHALCCESITLEQFIHRGGKAILNATFDTKLVLEPFAQLRLLSRILSAQSGVITARRSTNPLIRFTKIK
jgi:hypothetical protein